MIANYGRRQQKIVIFIVTIRKEYKEIYIKNTNH